MDSIVDEKRKVTQPHDKLVKKLLSNLNVAKDILKVLLPDILLNILDLDKLELEKETYFNFLFDEKKIDLLFKIPTKEDSGYAYVLLEHQSSVDKWMALRVIQYLGPIWDYLKNKIRNGKIPLIYPLVLYSGKKKYSKSVYIRDLIHPKSSCKILDSLFSSSFHLFDLNKMQDQELIIKIEKYPLGVALLLTLKHVFDDDLEATFKTILSDVYKKLDRDEYSNELSDMLNYLINEGNYSTVENFLEKIQQEFSLNVEERVMTMAQQLLTKGRLEGKVEGKVEGKHEEKIEIAKKMLDSNLDILFISKITGLKRDTIIKLSMKRS